MRCASDYPPLRQLTAELHTDRQGQPYAIVRGFPGLGTDLTPDQLGELARQLNQIRIDTQRHGAELRGEID